MAEPRRPAPLHAIYKLQDQVWSVLRTAGIVAHDVRVDEARRQVAVEVEARDVETATRVLRHLPDHLIVLRARRTSAEPPGDERRS